MNNDVSFRRKTLDILEKYNFKFKKSLGQNFLTEPTIVRKIIDTAKISQDTGVIEIGPGIGALTQEIAKKAGKVVGIEIDQRLIPILEETLSDFSNVKIINADVLKVSLEEIIAKELQKFKEIKIIANLPYYVTSPIIIKILKERLKFESITIMVQKEVAERIAAVPGGKDYGSLTLFVEYFAVSKIAFHLPNSVFIPRPKVDSAILHLELRDNPPYYIKDEDFLFKLIRASFMHRRKTLFNNLLNNLINKNKKAELEDILNRAHIDPKRRAETLSLKDFIELSNLLIKIYNF